jgi:hypothetical protein
MLKYLLLSKFSCKVIERPLEMNKYCFVLYNFPALYPTTEQNLLYFRIHCRIFFCAVGYNGRKTIPVWDTTGKNLCFVGNNRRKFVRKNPEIALWRIPHQRKTSSLVSHT